MNRKIWKALGIAVCMLALAAPRAMAETHVHMVTADTNFAEVVKTINASKDEDENVIELYDDITLAGNYTLTRNTTIKSKDKDKDKDKDRKISINGSNAGITVTGEGTVLNLGEKGYKGTLTIDGKTSGGFVTVSGRATANMYENVTLQNRKFSGNSSVHVDGEKSVFNLCGGVIRDCEEGLGSYAGAVRVDNQATFNMSSGEIRNCEGGKSGGVHVSNATFVMSGGTINGCSADTGGGLCAENSTVTIKNGTISGCTAGAGGGLYAENSTITISGGTIENNEAARGGGVALTNSTVKKDEQPIRNWTVVGNKAYKTGGGIWLGWGENVKKWDISDKSNKIYNNQAIEHGADICLEGGTSAIKLPIAANMGATYRNSGINIDGWYEDDNPRYEPSESGVAVDISKTLTGPRSLVASYKASPVRIEIDANGGVGGSGSQTVHEGTTVTLEAPTKEGHLFKGWKDENENSYPAGEDGKVNITVNEDMKLTAVWEARTFTVTYVLLNGETRAETVNYGQKVTLVEEPRTGYTFVGWKDGEEMYHAGETITVTGDMTLTAEWKKLPSAENLPKTGDESPVLLWGAALAVSAAACFMLRRKK